MYSDTHSKWIQIVIWYIQNLIISVLKLTHPKSCPPPLLLLPDIGTSGSWENTVKALRGARAPTIGPISTGPVGTWRSRTAGKEAVGIERVGHPLCADPFPAPVSSQLILAQPEETRMEAPDHSPHWAFYRATPLRLEFQLWGLVEAPSPSCPPGSGNSNKATLQG